MSPHEILGVAPNATIAEIKAAYRSKIKIAHPDAGGNAALFHAVKTAYDTMLAGLVQKAAKSNSVRLRSVSFVLTSDAVMPVMGVPFNDFILGYDLDIQITEEREVASGFWFWKKTNKTTNLFRGTFTVKPYTTFATLRFSDKYSKKVRFQIVSK